MHKSSDENNKLKGHLLPSIDHGRILLFWGIAIGIISIMLLSLFILNRPYRYQGSLIDPPKKAHEIQLEDQNGEKFSLKQQAGNVVLLFFGYTHCQDVCPITMAEFKQIRQAMGQRENEVKFVFITVDPERDTPEVIRKYINNFDPEIIGLSDDRSVLQEVWNNYGVVQDKANEISSADYQVDHTARIYVIDKKGNLRMTYPFGFETNRVIEDINHLLREDEG